ncbi:MAG: cyclic nucleotide-binding domain-containing protein [Pirellulales bacterium]
MKTESLPFEILRRIPIFRGLSESECRQLAETAATVEFAAGQEVLEQGRRSQQLWVLLEGTCEVIKRLPGGERAPEPIVLATLAPYSNFGEMSFFHSAPHSASVRAKTRVKLLLIERSDFDALVSGEASAACKLAINTVASLAERLRRMDDWVAELLANGTATQRVPEWNQLRSTLFDGWTL